MRAAPGSREAQLRIAQTKSSFSRFVQATAVWVCQDWWVLRAHRQGATDSPDRGRTHRVLRVGSRGTKFFADLKSTKNSPGPADPREPGRPSGPTKKPTDPVDPPESGKLHNLPGSRTRFRRTCLHGAQIGEWISSLHAATSITGEIQDGDFGWVRRRAFFMCPRTQTTRQRSTNAPRIRYFLQQRSSKGNQSTGTNTCVCATQLNMKGDDMLLVLYR